MNTHILTASVALLMAFNGLVSGDITEKRDIVAIEVNQPVRTIVINSDDQMRFDTNEIKVKAGEKVKLTLNHTGKLARHVMGHNFCPSHSRNKCAKFSQIAMNEKDNEYIPSSGVIAHTRLIGGGVPPLNSQLQRKVITILFVVFQVITQ